MTSGKLENGFRFDFDENKLNDMRFFEKLASAEENPLLIPSIIEDMLGKKQKEILYKFLEDENGRVPVDKCFAALEEIFDKAGAQVKNS